MRAPAKELAISLLGAFDTAAVLREFLNNSRPGLTRAEAPERPLTSPEQSQQPARRRKRLFGRSALGTAHQIMNRSAAEIINWGGDQYDMPHFYRKPRF